jgi:alpha-tubulin suppressor-like RCC1 family protein
VRKEKEDAAGRREAIEPGFKPEDRLSKVVAKDAVRRVLRALVVLTALVCCVGASAATPADAVGLAVGGGDSCVLRSSGHVDCWGWNQYSQLGNGTQASSGTPVEVQGVSAGVQLAAGGDDSCVVLPTGHIDCWGWNGFGQLGDGTEENGLEPGSPPVEVEGVSDATQVAVGDHSCAVLSTGHVKCWGEGAYGQLGDGKERRSLVPVEVLGISNAVQVAASSQGSCALLANSHVDCWGRNEYGELGNGSTADSSAPVEVKGITDATQVSTGEFYSCASLASGRIDCWGADYYGQLGDGSKTNSSTPVEVQGISDASEVAAGEGAREHVCALLSSGHIDCWGRNESGQLGNDTTTSSDTPVEVQGVADATEVGSGWRDSCALLSSGHVDCWGADDSGQLGDGTLGDSGLAVEAQGISDATQVGAGDYHSCATLSSGHVDCWGGNESGQLGDGTEENHDTPVEVQGIANASQVAGGVEHSCAALSTGHVDCWGNNESGQLGDGTITSSSTPVEVRGIANASQVAGGHEHSCALLSTGHVECWGNNAFGQLGDGSEANSSTPVQARGVTNATQVAAGSYHSCAVLSTGHVDCWGEDRAGELGDGKIEESSTIPVEVQGITNATQVVLDGYHSCAVLSTGHVDCWGNNFLFRLWKSTEENNDIPVEVEGVASATQLAAGSFHTCALLSTGRIDCWGENGFRQLGDGSEENSLIPVEVQGISSAIQIAARNDHTCALLSTGHVECWGGNDSGELGDGSAWSEVPKEVVGLNPGELTGSGPSSPSAVTGGTSSVTQSAATLEGSVNPNGAAVAAWCRFEYGPSEAYGSSVACPATLSGGSSPEDVSSSLTGLSVGTGYHYRLVAVNAAGGISYGADGTFTTIATPTLSVTSSPVGVAGTPIAASSISAVLVAGSSPTGTITFTVFGPQSSPPTSCTSGGTTVGTANVSGSGSYQPSAGFTPPSPGDYWWYASYGGDAGDEPTASACGALMAQTLVAAAPATGSGSGSGPGSSTGTGSGGPGPGAGSGTGPRTPAPTLSGVKLGSKSSTGKKGIALKLTLSQPATIRILIAQTVKGRKLRGVCKPQAKQGKSCTTTVEKRTLRFSGSTGSNALELRLAGLGRGSYTATITAENASGKSAPIKLTFTITHK